MRIFGKPISVGVAITIGTLATLSVVAASSAIYYYAIREDEQTTTTQENESEAGDETLVTIVTVDSVDYTIKLENMCIYAYWNESGTSYRAVMSFHCNFETIDAVDSGAIELTTGQLKEKFYQHLEVYNQNTEEWDKVPYEEYIEDIKGN